jgi:hypothetical protein
VSGGNYIFTDIAETITLSATAIAAGFTGSGTNTVVGPEAAVGILDIRTRDFEDTITFLSASNPVTADAGLTASGADTINSNGPINAVGYSSNFQASVFKQLLGATIAATELVVIGEVIQ